MELTLWKPFGEISPFRREVDSVFDRLFSSRFFMSDSDRLVPALDVTENEDSFLVKVELPGVEEKDVSITLTDGNLVVQGEKKEEKEEKNDLCYCSERRYGKFERVVELHSSVDGDKVKAQFRNGILEVNLPKKEEVKPKKVKIEFK